MVIPQIYSIHYNMAPSLTKLTQSCVISIFEIGLQLCRLLTRLCENRQSIQTNKIKNAEGETKAIYYKFRSSLYDLKLWFILQSFFIRNKKQVIFSLKYVCQIKTFKQFFCFFVTAIVKSTFFF